MGNPISFIKEQFRITKKSVSNPFAYCDINNSKLIFSSKIIVDITFDGVTKNSFCLYIILNRIMLTHVILGRHCIETIRIDSIE